MFLGVITARGGSKGIPGKNIIQCAGKPLLAYTCEAAMASKKLDHVIVSTDSPHIAEVARMLGLEAPFLRPAELASDTAPTIGVLQHALEWASHSQMNVTALVALQPTSPFRKAKHIDGAIELFQSVDADTVVTVVEVPHQFHPASIMEMNEQSQLHGLGGGVLIATRRQDLKKVYARNGPAVLVARAKCIADGELYGNRTYGYPMSAALNESLDIDTPNDLHLAEIMLNHFVE